MYICIYDKNQVKSEIINLDEHQRKQMQLIPFKGLAKNTISEKYILCRKAYFMQKSIHYAEKYILKS